MASDLPLCCLDGRQPRLTRWVADNQLPDESDGAIDTALRLARVLGTDERFWINLQADYDIAVELDEHRQRRTGKHSCANSRLIGGLGGAMTTNAQ